jgi:hypothetical protein
MPVAEKLLVKRFVRREAPSDLLIKMHQHIDSAQLYYSIALDGLKESERMDDLKSAHANALCGEPFITFVKGLKERYESRYGSPGKEVDERIAKTIDMRSKYFNLLKEQRAILPIRERLLKSLERTVLKGRALQSQPV